ncbi:hypothetical protein FHR84_002816 [Actinopolyspora biskrensis]|uniref:Uncharacterized protein n=1 Tax=Actinopolyspora biskrensis TaxID=1470178 RepID=A0A852YZ76_9ACTN|nr:hypothetical protein [Actinopolyspora biskrensis]NYH79478.1 hypothetical protein [Actinopolyspora biskrensis]
MTPAALMHQSPGLLVVLGAVTVLALGSALLPLRPGHRQRPGAAPLGRRARALRRR